MREYTLIVKGKRIPVSYNAYKTYYQEYEHERYLNNKAAKHEYSLEQFIEAGDPCICSSKSFVGHNLAWCLLRKVGCEQHPCCYIVSFQRHSKNPVDTHIYRAFAWSWWSESN